MTREALAEASGCSLSAIGAWERGLRTPDSEAQVRKVHRALGRLAVRSGSAADAGSVPTFSALWDSAVERMIWKQIPAASAWFAAARSERDQALAAAVATAAERDAAARQEARIAELEASVVEKNGLLRSMAQELQLTEGGGLPESLVRAHGRIMALGDRPPVEAPRQTHVGMPAELLPPRVRPRPPATLPRLVSILASLPTDQQVDFLASFTDQAERFLWHREFAAVEPVGTEPDQRRLTKSKKRPSKAD